MAREDMAAHLIRVTLTDAKIQKENMPVSSRLEQAAKYVVKPPGTQ